MGYTSEAHYLFLKSRSKKLSDYVPCQVLQVIGQVGQILDEWEAPKQKAFGSTCL